MFCPKCGSDVPADSQFCPKCGHGQTSIAVAPKKQGTAVKWTLGVVVFIVLCWAVWQLSLHAFSGSAPSAAQESPLQQHSQSTGNMAFPVDARGAYNYKFTVPAGALNATLKGHFVADGGSGKDIDVVIVSEDEYVNWQNGHPTKALYNSGKVTQDTISIALPAVPAAATYYVVFNNKFSLLTPKAVQANLDLNFYTR